MHRRELPSWGEGSGIPPAFGQATIGAVVNASVGEGADVATLFAQEEILDRLASVELAWVRDVRVDDPQIVKACHISKDHHVNMM